MSTATTTTAPTFTPLALRLTSNSLVTQAALVIGGAVALGLASQWEIPLWPVPVSAQSLFVLLIGAGLGARLGGISMLAYLSMGAAGLPMYSGGGAGVEHLFGPTAGYLVGFAAAAVFAGWMAERGWDRTVRHAVVTFSLGTLIILVFGVTGLMVGLGATLPQAFAAGVMPFWGGFLVKVGIASLVLPGLWSATRRHRDSQSA